MSMGSCGCQAHRVDPARTNQILMDQQNFINMMKSMNESINEQITRKETEIADIDCKINTNRQKLRSLRETVGSQFIRTRSKKLNMFVRCRHFWDATEWAAENKRRVSGRNRHSGQYSSFSKWTWNFKTYKSQNERQLSSCFRRQ